MPDILENLYNDYYLDNKTPNQFYSSYWKSLHTQSKVRIDNGKISQIQGVGFGELQSKSWANQLLFKLSIQAHLAKLTNHKDLRALIKIGAPLAKRMGLHFTNDCFRQVCSFALIRSYLKIDSPRVLIIGDGYGFLSAFIKEMMPKARVCLVDLGKTLFFQAYGLQKAFPNAHHSLVSSSSGSLQTQPQADFIYCSAECLNMIDDVTFDLAINICSFQEMNNETVKGYFEFLRNHLAEDNLFYCCNRIEKVMEGGEISKFYEYPWQKGDVHYVDEPCQWNQFFMAVHPARNGPKLFNLIRIPFISYYDGPINHRLSRMETNRTL